MISTGECRWVLVILSLCIRKGCVYEIVMSNDRRAEPIASFIILWLVHEMSRGQRLFHLEMLLIQLLYLRNLPDDWRTLNALMYSDL